MHFKSCFTRLCFSLCFSLFILQPLVSQNLYDYSHTLKFAEHLMSSGQYEYAAQEYERLLYLREAVSDSVHLMLLRAYRKSGNTDIGIQRARHLYPRPASMPRLLSIEYIHLLLDNRSYGRLHLFVDSNQTLPTPEKQTIRIHTALVNKQWQQAKQLAAATDTTRSYPPLNAYHPLVQDALDRKHRSVGLACGLSAIVPGLGKVYTGHWKDGLISFFMVGLNAWQSYRGFRLRGIESAYGWIFGGIGLAFYAGNIYGTAKSAVQFNRKVEHNLIHRAETTWNKYY